MNTQPGHRVRFHRLRRWRRVLAAIGIFSAAVWLASAWVGGYYRWKRGFVALSSGALNVVVFTAEDADLFADSGFHVRDGWPRLFLSVVWQRWGADRAQLIVPLWPLLLAGGVVTIGLWHWEKRAAARAGLCKRCCYDLSGIVGPCPECGTARA